MWDVSPASDWTWPPPSDDWEIFSQIEDTLRNTKPVRAQPKLNLNTSNRDDPARQRQIETIKRAIQKKKGLQNKKI